MVMVAVRMAVRIPLVHSSVPVLALVKDSRQMEQNVLVCHTTYYLWVWNLAIS